VPAGATDRLVERQFAGDPVRGGREFERTGVVLELDMEDPVGLGDAADLVEKIHVPGAAAELAIGDALEAELGLHRDGLFDAVVLAAAQGLGGYPALLMLGPRRQERLRSQQAADMIGAKRRTGRIAHRNLLRAVCRMG